jgi:dienelactone hydrolase
MCDYQRNRMYILFSLILLVFALQVENFSFTPRSIRSMRIYKNKYDDILPSTPSDDDTLLSILNSSPGNDVANLENSINDIVAREEEQMKALAVDLLDCLTSTKDPESPEYDVGKDVRRDELLLHNDYSALKVELRLRGLSTSGDKLEMMIRLLAHIIDPSVKFSVMTGQEVKLSFINKTDIETNKLRIVPEEERETDITDNGGPDADDLQVLKKRRTIVSSSIDSKGVEKVQYKPRADDKKKIVMDGMVRKEISFSPVRVKQRQPVSRYLDDNDDLVIRAYVVGGRDVLRSWSKTSAVVILLPDTSGWTNKQTRILADEIAFYHQSVVCVPDIYRGLRDEAALNQIEAHPNCVFDDIVAALQFAKSEYDSKAISIAGVGYGAGLALEAACDLSDMTAFAIAQNAQAVKYPSQSINPAYVMEKMTKRSKLINEARIAAMKANNDSSSDDEAELSKQPQTSFSTEEIIAKIKIMEARGRSMISPYASLSLSQLTKLCPLTVVAWSPKRFNPIDVGARLQIPCYISSAGNPKNSSSSYKSSNQLYEQLYYRMNEVYDFSFRLYETSSDDFLLHPQTANDRKASHDAVLLGSYWMDIYSRYAVQESLTGAGSTKLQQPFVVLRKQELDMRDERDSPIGYYLHDEVDLFTNALLPSDQQIQAMSQVDS